MKNRRSLTDVVFDILQKANGGSTKTKLMYETGLSYKSLKAYVFRLAQNGLLEFEPMEERYRTTDKGFQFIQTYDQMNTISSLINVMKQRSI